MAVLRPALGDALTICNSDSKTCILHLLDVHELNRDVQSVQRRLQLFWGSRWRFGGSRNVDRRVAGLHLLVGRLHDGFGVDFHGGPHGWLQSRNASDGDWPTVLRQPNGDATQGVTLVKVWLRL